VPPIRFDIDFLDDALEPIHPLLDQLNLLFISQDKGLPIAGPILDILSDEDFNAVTSNLSQGCELEGSAPSLPRPAPPLRN